MVSSISTSGHSVCIVVPVFNEHRNAQALVEHLAQLDPDQVVIVDGGSTDGTNLLLRELVASRTNWQLLNSSKGRAAQLIQGVQQVRTRWLVMLHADTQLPLSFRSAIKECEAKEYGWGRFNVQFMPVTRGFDLAMHVVSTFMNWRSRLTQIATGDQAIFVRNDLLNKVGGVPKLPLLEDIELSKSLKGVAPMYASPLRVLTSARRWHQRGLVRTILLMWGIRLAYFCGISAQRLAGWYKAVR